jgi:hypothetical protein
VCVLDAVGKKPWKNAGKPAVFAAKKRENSTKTVFFFNRTRRCTQNGIKPYRLAARVLSLIIFLSRASLAVHTPVLNVAGSPQGNETGMKPRETPQARSKGFHCLSTAITIVYGV